MHSAVKCLFAVALTLLAARADAERLQVVADVWCPFNCQPDAPLPGYIIEVLASIFPQHQIDYQVVPWKRAILQTRQGISTAAIAATAPMVHEGKLLISQQQVGHAYDCLYVAPGSAHEYHGQASDLQGLQRLGIALGYEYVDGIGEWLADPANKKKYFAESGAEPARRNLRKLMVGGLDGMIEDRSVMSFLLLDSAYAGRVVSVGCNQAVPLYMGFSPKQPGADKLLEQFDHELVALRQSGRLAQILAKYGVEDWQP